VQQARAFGLLSGSLATIAYLAYAFSLLPPGERMPAMALSLTVLPSAWIALQEAIFVATPARNHWIAIVAIVENSLKMSIAVVGLLTGHGLLTICIGNRHRARCGAGHRPPGCCGAGAACPAPWQHGLSRG